jgi:hypothetical protein
MKISEKARKILNNRERLEKQAAWFRRLGDLFAGQSNEYFDEYVFAVNGIYGSSEADLYTNPEEWTVSTLENLAERIGETEKDYLFVPLCIEYNIFGVHFIDKIFGARVFFQDNQWYNDYISTKIGQLVKPDLEKNETWSLAQRATYAFLDQEVKLPLFGLPTIASALNIAVNLYGQEFLVAMMLEPENAAHDLLVINNLLCEIHWWYLNKVPLQNLQPVISAQRTQPPGYGQLCGCTTQLISGESYRNMIAPLDAALLGIYPNGGMIHLCGSHLQHLDTFRSMTALRAFQVNDRAAHDLADYFKGLRNDQILYLNPCEGMTVEQAVKITGGDRLVIVGDAGYAIRRHP